MATKEMTARDAKIVQYLNDAYATERRLEIALQAHIAMTPRADYKKRLRDHLKETKAHARLVARRIKALGGEAETMSLPGPDAVVKGATGAKAAVQRAAAIAQGPLHAVRGTGQQERMLKNARTEYQDEAEEIATYRVVEAVAKAVGDKETAKLARDIGRQEKRMADYLVDLIDQLALDVVHDEVPVAEIGATSAARRTASGTSGATRSAKSTSSRAKASGSRAKTTSARSRATTARAASKPASRAKAKPAARSSSSKPASRSSSPKPAARSSSSKPASRTKSSSPKPASRSSSSKPASRTKSSSSKPASRTKSSSSKPATRTKSARSKPASRTKSASRSTAKRS